MTFKSIIFADNNSSIIVELVKKYELEKKLKDGGRSTGLLDIIAGGELAQLCRDIVEKRISSEDAVLKIQKIFNISANIANKILTELNQKVIALAETITIEDDSENVSNYKNMPIENTDDKNLKKVLKNEKKESSNQDSYREPTK